MSRKVCKPQSLDRTLAVTNCKKCSKSKPSGVCGAAVGSNQVRIAQPQEKQWNAQPPRIVEKFCICLAPSLTSPLSTAARCLSQQIPFELFVFFLLFVVFGLHSPSVLTPIVV